MKYILFLLMAIIPAAASAQTYASVDAKWDHKWISDGFTPAASTTVADEVGANDGTTGGNNTDVYDVTGPVAWIPYALDINAFAARVITLDSAITDTDGTIFFRFRRTSTASNDVAIGEDAAGTQYIMFRSDATTLRFRVNSTNQDATMTATGTTWHSCAISRNGTSGATVYYIDGSQIDSTTHQAGTAWLWQSIGDSNGGSRFVGELCDVCFANEVLTGTEIAAYNSGPSSGNPLLLQLLLTSVVFTLSLTYFARRRGQ